MWAAVAVFQWKEWISLCAGNVCRVSSEKTKEKPKRGKQENMMQ